METKEEYMKRISAQFGENIVEMQKQYTTFLEYLKAARPNEKIAVLEEKAFNLLKGHYQTVVNSQGQRYVGIVTEVTETKDKNEYVLSTIKKLQDNQDELEQFLSDQHKNFGTQMRVENGKVFVKTKDGTKEYELLNRYQKTVSGIFMDRDNQLKQFVMYWTQQNITDNPYPDVMYEPVEFRGKVGGTTQDGRIIINSVKTTTFKPTKDAFPSFETLLMEKKFGTPTRIEQVSLLPKNSKFYSLVDFSSMQGSENYGARGTIFINDDQYTVKFPQGFDVHTVDGFNLGIPCVIFGKYAPYQNKETGATVKQIEATGLYVMQKDRPKTEVQISLNTWVGDA